MSQPEIPADIKRHSYLQRKFTPNFLFRVTEATIKQIKTEFPRRVVFNKDLEAVLTTRTRGTSLPRMTSLTPQETPDTSEIALREHELKAGAISEEKLWQEIIDHFKSNLDKKIAVSLSTTAASTLAAASVNLEHGKTTQSSRANVVVFTCEHSFPSVHFKDMILPEFEHRMLELPKPLSQFLEQLVMRYRQRSEVYPTSCPACVYNFLREEQIKDKRFNTGGKLPQPWDI